MAYVRRFFQKTTFLSSVLIISTILMSCGFSNVAFADGQGISHEYDFVAGIHNQVTFHFRDGVETVTFPVFSTTSDIVSNAGTSFELEGVIGHNPHLHQALDEAYKYRLSTLTGGSSFEFNHRFFDVDVNVIVDETIIKSFEYNNCEISSHGVTTVNDDYESYLTSNSGFAIVNSIEFRCGGVHINQDHHISGDSRSPSSLTDHGSLPFKQANDIHTFLTFEFDSGAEKIESVIFTLTSGFNEEDYGTPSFQIITAVLPHPLIDNAIMKSQKVAGLASTFNDDFDVNVEFVTPEKLSGLALTPAQTIRALEFEDCIVSGYDILTLRDKEEGYTGKRGFATAEVLDVECSGVNPVNPTYANKKSNSVLNTHDYNMGMGPHAIATFDFNGDIEIIDFPEFYQGNLIARANPTFQLVGAPGITPLLYGAVDDARKTDSKSTGVSASDKMFDVNISMMYGDILVRGYDYSKCRIVNYVIKTEHDSEESFYNGFALTNEFHFECLGYSPIISHLDTGDPSKGKTESSKDYQSKQHPAWGPGFAYVPK